MSKTKQTNKQLDSLVDWINRRETTQVYSSLCVDREWDKIEESEKEFVERLRTRGTF